MNDRPILVRVLAHDAGVTARERLDEYLAGDDLAVAADAADLPILVVDDAPPVAAQVVQALESAGAVARLSAARLVVVARRSQLERACDGIAPSERTLLNALVGGWDGAMGRPQQLRARTKTVDFADGAAVMGILNVTPDSFYDRGEYHAVDRARRRAHEMVAQGARVIDIGGQSYAHWNRRIAAGEERARVVPVVEALVRDELGCAISIDTFKATVAAGALDAGADLINDCSGLSDPELAATVARYDAALVVMHLRGELNVRAPQYPYADVMAEIVGFLRERVELAAAAGVARDSLAIDPGLEFGKEPPTDLEILERFGDLRVLGLPILFAASRKSFIGRVFDRPARDLLVPSLATAALGIAAGAQLVRVHDVAETVALAQMMGVVRRDRRRKVHYADAMPTG